MAKILYVEDDLMVAANVQEWLQREGHLVEVAETGEDGLQLCENFEYDVLLLDWDLPGIPGLEVCKQYRAAGGNGWVIFLTGKTAIDDKETGLDAGADDYLTKPFEVRELSARVRRALRRTDGTFQSELRVGDVLLDSNTRTLKIGEQSVRLMPKEAALLEYLMRNPNKIISTDKLLSAVWPSESSVSNGTVRTFMLTLRKKLQDVGKTDWIRTVPGSGYLLEKADG